MKSGNLNFLEPYGPLQACNGTTLLAYVAYMETCNLGGSFDFAAAPSEQKTRNQINCFNGENRTWEKTLRKTERNVWRIPHAFSKEFFMNTIKII